MPPIERITDRMSCRPCCMSIATASKPWRATSSGTSGSGSWVQPEISVSPARRRSARPVMSLPPGAGSGPGFDLPDGRRHQIGHGAADLVVGFTDAAGIEVGAYLAEDILVAGLLEVGCDHRFRIFLGGFAAFSELFRRPQAEEHVPPRRCLEFERLVERELGL